MRMSLLLAAKFCGLGIGFPIQQIIVHPEDLVPERSVGILDDTIPAPSPINVDDNISDLPVADHIIEVPDEETANIEGFDHALSHAEDLLDEYDNGGPVPQYLPDELRETFDALRNWPKMWRPRRVLDMEAQLRQSLLERESDNSVNDEEFGLRRNRSNSSVGPSVDEESDAETLPSDAKALADLGEPGQFSDEIENDSTGNSDSLHDGEEAEGAEEAAESDQPEGDIESQDESDLEPDPLPGTSRNDGASANSSKEDHSLHVQAEESTKRSASGSPEPLRKKARNMASDVEASDSELEDESSDQANASTSEADNEGSQVSASPADDLADEPASMPESPPVRPAYRPFTDSPRYRVEDFEEIAGDIEGGTSSAEEILATIMSLFGL